jgi:hypothetical protein
MNRYDKALRSLQPNVKDLARAFLLDRNFGVHETCRRMIILFTLSEDSRVGFRRLRLETYHHGDYVPMLCHDTDVVPYGSDDFPIPLSPKIQRQTLENVMELFDSTPIKHVISVTVKKTYIESDTVYHWHDVHDLARKAV